MKTFLPVQSCSASLFLLRPAGAGFQVLLMRRTGSLAGTWCHVAGGIEAGEKAWQTMRREALEETGLALTEIWSADICEQFYEADKECLTIVPVFVSFVAPDAKVQINDEHDRFDWLDLDEACERYSFPGQRRALNTVWEEFVNRKPNPLLRIWREPS